LNLASTPSGRIEQGRFGDLCGAVAHDAIAAGLPSGIRASGLSNEQFTHAADCVRSGFR
jgi:hypothetical protein